MDTRSTHSPALDRLTTLAALLDAEFLHLPDAATFFGTSSNPQPMTGSAPLHLAIARFWEAASARDISRRELLVTSLELTLRDDVLLNIEEGELHREYSRCLPGMDAQEHVVFSALELKIDQQTCIELAGAIVATAQAGMTLLCLPGQSVEGFVSHKTLLQALARRINHPVLRLPLLRLMHESTREAWLEIGSGGDVFPEPISPADFHLKPVKGSPYEHAFDRLLAKQRVDIDELLETGDDLSPQALAARLEDRLHQPKSWGPEAAVAAAHDRRFLRERRRAQPDWLEMASAEQRERYVAGLMTYEQARSALTSVMGSAASAQQFARSHLRTRLANDLGLDIDPDDVLMTTERALPLTEQPYTVGRSLTQLALYGLHPGDTEQDSDFQTRTRITYGGEPLEPELAGMSPAYLAGVIIEQDLRARFGPAQREALGSPVTQRMMCEVMHHQLVAQARGAQLQGHIQPADLLMIESLDPHPTAPASPNVAIQHIKLNGRDTLSNVLVIRKLDVAGKSDGLLMFTPDSPRAQHFQRFENDRQLLGELVSWSASAELTGFLLRQISAERRDTLKHQLQNLSEKPAPTADWLSYTTLADYSTGLRALVSARVKVTLSEQQQHTPHWFLRASAEQRQQMVALEDALVGAADLYTSAARTQAIDFSTYVHQAARQQLSQLLGVAPGAVDPDRVIVRTPRETLSYTQLLRDGYDDSIGLLNASADTTATFKGPEGIDLSPLSPEKVAASVRGQWVADQYITMIRKQLLDPASEGYAWRRRHSLLLTQLQMRVATLRGFLEGHIDASHLHWLTGSVLNMHHNSPAERLRYPVYPLLVNVHAGITGVPAEIIHGCFLLLPPQAKTLDEVLLYTPQAPDGRAFRPLTAFCNTLLSEGMGDYYLRRARAKAGMPLAFAFADLKQGKGRKPSLPREPFRDLYDVCFNQVIERRIRDVQDTEKGRADMLARQLWGGFELIATAVTLPFPPASFAVGMLIAGVDGYRALSALNERDHAAASVHVLSVWLNAAGAAGDLHSGIKGLGGVLKELVGPEKAGRGVRSIPQPTDETLRPVVVENALFWAGQPSGNRHVPLYRTQALLPETLQPTGHYARTDASGIWHALQQDTPPVPGNDVAHLPSGYAVNVSLNEAVSLGSEHGRGVKVLRGNCYVSLHGQTFQVQYDPGLSAWQIIDPGNPFAFFGKQPVRLDSQGQWQLLEPARLRGGVLPAFRRLGETPAGPATAVGDISDYEMPESLQRYIFGIVSPRQAERFEEGPFGLREFFDEVFKTGRSTYKALRENLYRDAKVFFEQPPLPGKPALPVLEEGITVPAFFKAALETSNGLVIGEAPTSIASKQLLIDNMPLLAEQRVEVLYIEHLETDQHLHKLQKYRALGTKTRSGSHMIKHHLDTVNDGALKNGSNKYDYYHLIKTAHRHGIEVRPFSSSISYDYADNEVASALGDSLATQKMAVFFGNKVISQDVQAHPARRWIALLDHRFANTWHQQPGISELQGVLSLRVEDGARSRPIRIAADTDTVNSAASRADFIAQIGNPTLSETAGAPAHVSPSNTSLDGALQRLLEGRPNSQWGIDPNRRAFVSPPRNDTNLYVGDHGFERNTAGRWIRADAASWTDDYPLGAIQQSLIDSHYQLPVQMRAVFHDLAHFRHRGLNPDYFFVESHLLEVRDAFFTIAKELQMDARSVLTMALPERVILPQVKADTPLSMVIEELYENTSGLVVGESHSAIASKRFILDNMEHLARQDVKTLYMEHLLTDIHQADLDRFADTGAMSKCLLHDLRHLDNGFGTDPSGVYSFENLVVQARRHGIEIRAVDCAASYYIRHVPTNSDTTRQQVLSYFASRTMRRHQQVMGSHKWIALVGESHANTFKNSVPGIAELEQGIGVRVVDVAAGQGQGIMIDPGEHVLTAIGQERVWVKNDFRIQIELPARPPLAIPVGARLHNPGMFLIDTSNPLQPTVIHRARDLTLKETPVQFDPSGKVYVEREPWPKVHRHMFNSLEDLIEALGEMNLKHVG